MHLNYFNINHIILKKKLCKKNIFYYKFSYFCFNDAPFKSSEQKRVNMFSSDFAFQCMIHEHLLTSEFSEYIHFIIFDDKS